MEFPHLFYTDDDPDDLLFFGQATDGLEAFVHLFSDGNQMLRALRNANGPLVVFLDLNMPLKTGYELIGEIRSCSKLTQFPVVVLSTAADEKNIERCRKAGADYYIKKPHNLRILRKAVGHVLASVREGNNPAETGFCYKY